MRLPVVVLALVALAACRDRTTVRPGVDSGIQCTDQERIVNGECVFICDRDSDCGTGQRCNLFTGACEAKPPEPDAGPARNPCTTGAERCTADNKAIEKCSLDGTWATSQTCTPPSGFCLNEVCLACQPGTTRCSNPTTLEICKDDGSGYRQVACAATATCAVTECRECPPNATRCDASNQAQQTCTRTADETNSWKWVNSGDAFDGTCVTRVCELNPQNQSVCRAPQCIPGATQCKSTTTQQVCSTTGTFNDVVCSTLPGMGPNAECQNGTCFDECADAIKAKSYFGCEYWTAVQDNGVDTLFKGGTTSGQGNADSDFAFVVTNRSTSPATVEIWRHNGTAAVRIKQVTVPGRLDVGTKGLMTINVPWQSIGTSAAVGTESATGRARYGYRIVSTRPVTVYQFNPLPAVKYTKACTASVGTVDCSCDESGGFNAFNCLVFGEGGGICATAPGGGKRCSYNSYTNDASLLLPAHILGTSHVAVTPHTIGMTQNVNQAPVAPNGQLINSNLTIVGTQDATQVTVKVSAATAAGGGIAAMAKAAQQTFTLNSYDVLQLASTHLGATYIQCTTNPFGGGQVCRIDNDLTGSIVTSDKPIAVFGGAACSLTPYNRAACDHLEEQIFPFATWGKNFIAVRTAPLRLNNNTFATNSPPDYYKVVASCPTSQCAAGTRITINPVPSAANVLPPNRCTTGSLATNDCQLAGGQFMEFAATTSMQIIGDQPIAVAQFFAGQGDVGVLPTDPAQGDPSMVLLPPVEQWRSSYTVLAAPGIKDNYIGISIDTNKVASVDVDGTAVTGFSPIGGTSFQVKNHPVTVGTHTVTVTAKPMMQSAAGVTVYGYDAYVSYGYTGGLDLGTIVTGINPGG